MAKIKTYYRDGVELISIGLPGDPSEDDFDRIFRAHTLIITPNQSDEEIIPDESSNNEIPPEEIPN